jgi:hypothetical protein
MCTAVVFNQQVQNNVKQAHKASAEKLLIYRLGIEVMLLNIKCPSHYVNEMKPVIYFFIKNPVPLA